MMNIFSPDFETVKRVAIMQPYFFPYAGYFQLILASDLFVLFDDVHFIKKGWVHRNRIILQNQEHLFTLPLSGASQNKTIQTLFASDFILFKNEFLKTLNHNYKKSPHFENGIKIIEEALNVPSFDLVSICEHSLKTICKYLEIKTHFLKSSAFQIDVQFKGQERILKILEILKAKIYINAAGGKLLYKKEDFENKDIELLFMITPEPHKYTQMSSQFIPHLSIVDLLLCCDLNEIKKYIHNYSVECA